MNIRRVKRKCNVRGCKNTDCFAMSLTSEIGNTVIICPECAKESAEVIEKAVSCGAKVINSVKENVTSPSLFFHPEKKDNHLNCDIDDFDEEMDDSGSNSHTTTSSDLKLSVSSNVDNKGNADDNDSEVENDLSDDRNTSTADENSKKIAQIKEGSLACIICGRTFESERGLKTHMRSHEGD